MSPWIPNPRPGSKRPRTRKYRRLHLQLALEVSLDRLRNMQGKQARKRQASEDFRKGQT
jgi:hypothetical protein